MINPQPRMQNPEKDKQAAVLEAWEVWEVIVILQPEVCNDLFCQCEYVNEEKRSGAVLFMICYFMEYIFFLCYQCNKKSLLLNCIINHLALQS